MMPSINYDLIATVTQITADPLTHRPDHYFVGFTYERRAPIKGVQTLYVGVTLPEITEILSRLQHFITPSTVMKGESIDLKLLLPQAPSQKPARVA